MAQSQRRLSAAEESEKGFAPWFTSTQPSSSPSEVLSYVVQRRACTTMAALSSFQKHDVPWRVPAWDACETRLLANTHVAASTEISRAVVCDYGAPPSSARAFHMRWAGHGEKSVVWVV
jgi:hypothetical protein